MTTDGTGGDLTDDGSTRVRSAPQLADRSVDADGLLWAPRASRVAIRTPFGDSDLRRGGGGWWVHDQPVDTPYYLVVDGHPIPDPRSPSQPFGLHGPSAPLSEFAWTDTSWSGRTLRDAVLYELHVGTFSRQGTFDGVIEHLDHLVTLGIDAIELMPVATFPGHRGWGYDGALLFAAHHAYGGPDGLRRLVDACHAAGIAVVLDVVYNHLGPTGNHLASLGPYFDDAESTPWGAAVDLDGPGSPEVRRFFVDNARAWIEDFHLDGVRLDALHALSDRSSTHFVRELSDELHRLADDLGRPVWVIGESDLNRPDAVDATSDGSTWSLDAVWSDDFHHALHTAITGEQHSFLADFDGWSDVVRALERVYVYDGRLSPHRGAVHGAPVGDRRRRRFLGYLQNHDQIGNRALGERIGHLVDSRTLQTAAALVLTAPFVPMIFQGEEWNASTPFQYFTDHHDPRIAAAVTDGRRREFPSIAEAGGIVPDPQRSETFERCVLDWGELDRSPHAEMLRWYRELIRLRRSLPGLGTDGPDDTRARHDESRRMLVVERGADVVVIVNTGPEPLVLDEHLTPTADDHSLELSNDPDIWPQMSNGSSTDPTPRVLAGGCVAIFARRVDSPATDEVPASRTSTHSP